MMGRSVWLVLTLCACNELLALDGTTDERDTDGDGIVDSLDNCPGIFNPDQADRDHDTIGDVCDSCPDDLPIGDSDHDGIDDACDPCLFGGSHDEDSDGIPDACDVCPSIYDPPATKDALQADVDHDGVGDACDPDSTITNRHVYFDPFAPPDLRWVSSAWHSSADGDGVEVAEGAAGVSPPAFTNPAVRITAPAWSISTTIGRPRLGMLTFNPELGIVGADLMGALSIECEIVFVPAKGTYKLLLSVGIINSSGTQEIPAVDDTRLVLSAMAVGNGLSTYTCSVPGIDSLTAKSQTVLISPGLFSTVVAEFRYIDVVE